MFPYKPSSYGGTPIFWNHHMGMDMDVHCVHSCPQKLYSFPLVPWSHHPFISITSQVFHICGFIPYSTWLSHGFWGCLVMSSREAKKGGFLSHRATPSSYPFSIWIFHEINHPAMGISPFRNPHIGFAHGFPRIRHLLGRREIFQKTPPLCLARGLREGPKIGHQKRRWLIIKWNVDLIIKHWFQNCCIESWY